MSALSYQSEPQIQFLHQLVRDIRDGTIQLPRFQRPYVWTDDQRLELFRSVHTGTPIGTIMLWRTGSVQMKCYEELGSYKLSAPVGAVRTYIVDGHQRLATLFSALHAPPDGTPMAEQSAYFDLESEGFLLAPSTDAPLPSWLPLRFVLDFSKLLPFQRSLMARPDAESLVRRADKVVAAFGQYKVPVVTIVTDDLEQIAKTFQRINSPGTVMGEVHMISALTWSPDFDLNELISDLKEKYLAPLGWGDLEEDAILRACKLALGLPLYDPRRNVDRVRREIRQMPAVFDEVRTAMVTAIGFLKHFCNIHSPRILPYPSHFVPLTEAIRRYPVRVEEKSRDTLRRWFWAMAYASRRLALEKLPDILDELDDNGAGAQRRPSKRAGPLDPLPHVFDFRHGRCRTLSLRMGELVGPEAAEWLGLHGFAAVPHLLYGTMKVPQDLFESPANRIVVDPDQANKERSRIREACQRKVRNEDDRDVLHRHAIPVEAANAYAAGDLPRFFALRLAVLDELENDFARQMDLLSP